MRKVHHGRTDKSGNFRNISRKEEGYLKGIDEDHPFPALVTAWYPTSQTIDVARPVENGVIEYKGVIVYGDFFDATGTIRSPKIATKLKENGYTAFRNNDQINPSSNDYVLDNHIEAIVFKVAGRNDFAYVSNSFRFINTDSPLLNNARPGRKIIRHDDGSYYIHDDDGNIQFRHPSGLNVRVGSSVSDMDLEVPFPPHEKNATNYGGEVITRVDHPSGSYLEMTNTGTINIESAEDINLSAVNVNVTASTKYKVTAPDTEFLDSVKFKVTSPESEMTGNLTVGGIIKAVGDVIADWMATAISLINHFHPGNLGYNTGAPLPAGGGTAPPSSPPEYDDGTQTADLKGMDLTNVGSMTGTVGGHDHNYTWEDDAGSGTTGPPN
jgi:hypothetical protein